MKAAEIKALKDAELGVLVQKFRGELFTLRNKRVSEQVEDNSRFGKLRKDIARLKTEQRARQGG